MTGVVNEQVLIIEVGTGNLGDAVCVRIEQALLEQPSGTAFVLDLSRRQRISARSLGRLMRLCQRARQRAIALHLVGPDEMRALMDLTSLDRLLQIHPDKSSLRAALDIDHARVRVISITAETFAEKADGGVSVA